MQNTALILTDGLLNDIHAKTAHGLLLGASRYQILGIIDKKHAGLDAGMVVANKPLSIPVFADVTQALNQLSNKPDYCVVGVASIGGVLSDTLVKTIQEAMSHQVNIVSGLHTLLSEHPQIAPIAKEKGVELIDIRKPKSYRQLHMWKGDIHEIKTPRIAVLGMDCAIGKRTTAGLLLALCRENGISAEMIYTGQTGWLQGMKYGFILDSTLNDFVAGELEHAIVRCVAESNPALIFIEGQSALRNPSGPCGAEMLCSARAQYVILQHSPMRQYFDGNPFYKIPSLQDEIALIKQYGAEVIAITLNSQDIPSDQLQAIKTDIAKKTGLPVVYPRIEGLASLLPLLKSLVTQQ